MNEQNIELKEEIYPELYCIETVLGCDLSCVECATGGGLITRKKGHMSFENFKIIADKIKPYAKFVYLFTWGEPMLNKEIIDIIKYTSEFAKTHISTNCKCLTPQLAEELIKSGLSYLVLSIDGMTQEVYEKYRKGGNLKKSLEYLKLFNDLNIKYGKKVYIAAQYCVFQHNQHEMQAFEDFCKELGLSPTFRKPYIRKNSQLEQPDDPKLRRVIYKNIQEANQAMKDCSTFDKSMNIQLDGSATICCYDYNGQISFGNLFEQNMEEIWNSKNYKKLRENGKHGIVPSFCNKNCYAYPLEENMKI